MTDSQSILMSNPLWELRPDINSVWKLLSCLCGASSLMRGKMRLFSVNPKLVEVTLRPTIGQSLCLGVETTWGLVTRYYFLSECCCLKFAVLFLWGALSDERTGLEFAVQSINGPTRAEPVTILYCLIWDPPNLAGQVPVFISPRNGLVQLNPCVLGSLFIASYDLQGYGGVILTQLHMVESSLKPSQVILRPTVSLPVCLGVRHPSQTHDQCFPSFFNYDIFTQLQI
jgi:hypothetical protein